MANVRRLLPLLCLVACDGHEPQAPTYTSRGHALDAFCVAQVDGSGAVAVEADYIPRVVACENGSADFEALRAQAVAARSYLYYKLETSGRIGDGQQDQVYTCGRAPGPEHVRAAASTAGEVLRYNGQTIAAFYVSGAIPSADDCVARAGDRDPHGTERYVTYNRGRRGDGIEQTTLGWVNAGNFRNRGCKSQNGANCLSRGGVGYRDILTFYYGEDIQRVRAEGPCVEGEPPPPPPPPPPPACPPVGDAERVVDEEGACFERSCETGDWWTDVESGHGGHAWTTGTIDQPDPDCVGRWQLGFERDGDYEVAAYVAAGGDLLSRQARYAVRHAGRDTDVVVDQRGRDGWVSLGVFGFVAGADQWVSLADNTGEPYMRGGVRLVYDALRVRPPSAQPEPDARAPPPPPPSARDAGSPRPDDAGEDLEDLNGRGLRDAESDAATGPEVDREAGREGPRGDAGGDPPGAALLGGGCGFGGAWAGAGGWLFAIGRRRRPRRKTPG